MGEIQHKLLSFPVKIMVVTYFGIGNGLGVGNFLIIIEAVWVLDEVFILDWGKQKEDLVVYAA